jgi:hypothetical protein
MSIFVSTSQLQVLLGLDSELVNEGKTQNACRHLVSQAQVVEVDT